MFSAALRPALALGLALAFAPAALAQEYKIEEVPSVSGLDPARLKARTIAFTDHRKDPLADSVTGLLRFAEWSRARPAQKAALSLYPAYAEPTVTVSVNGIEKPYLEKLHVYVAEARFIVDRPPGSIDLARYGRIDFVETLDPAIKHKPLKAEDATPVKNAEAAYNRHPERRWCEGEGALCIVSRYALEGKLPIGIRLANRLEESGKKIAEYIEFESELRILPAAEAERLGLAQLTGLPTPVVGAVEQNLFHVNQMMQFGKFVAVLQAHPADPAKTVATVFLALGIESDVLEKKKEYERVPVLRNLVPAQVLMGQSSFNTGTSISAGLPDYARNRIKAIAALLEGK